MRNVYVIVVGTELQVLRSVRPDWRVSRGSFSKSPRYDSHWTGEYAHIMGWWLVLRDRASLQRPGEPRIFKQTIRPTERSRHATTSAAGDPRSKNGSPPDPMWGKWSLLNCLNFAVFRALWPVYMYALGLGDVCRVNGGMTYRHRDVKLTAGPSLWRPNSSPTPPYPPHPHKTKQ